MVVAFISSEYIRLHFNDNGELTFTTLLENQPQPPQHMLHQPIRFVVFSPGLARFDESNGKHTENFSLIKSFTFADPPPDEHMHGW